MMKIIKITPRGYCHGVVSALQDVAIAINNDKLKKPIYILGEIVHNHIITDAFSSKGVITLNGKSREELLEEIEYGTVIITAHGVSQSIIDRAKEKNLDIIDATCVDVYKTHDLIKKKISEQYEILYIGKKDHPEPEGAISISPQNIHLITNISDLLNFKPKSDKLLITNQTTMSIWDTIKIIEEAKKIFPHIEVYNEICSATQQRQEAVLLNAKKIDLLIVVGDTNSNNTNRLAQIAEQQANIKAIRINDLNELDINILLNENIETVGITSGASTPTLVTSMVINYIEQFKKDDESTWLKNTDIDLERIIPRVKNAKNK